MDKLYTIETGDVIDLSRIAAVSRVKTKLSKGTVMGGVSAGGTVDIEVAFFIIVFVDSISDFTISAASEIRGHRNKLIAAWREYNKKPLQGGMHFVEDPKGDITMSFPPDHIERTGRLEWK